MNRIPPLTPEQPELMSHRRLFRWLLAGGSISLLILWGLSLLIISEITFSPRVGNFSLSGSIYSGTASLALNPYDQASSTFQASSIPVASLHHQIRKAYHPFPKPEIGRVPTMGCGAGTGHFNYYLNLPMWVLYLAFVGSALWFYRCTLRRSSHVEEIALARAERDSSGRQAVTKAIRFNQNPTSNVLPL